MPVHATTGVNKYCFESLKCINKQARMKSHGVMIDITDPATTMKNSIVTLRKQKFGGTIVRP